MDPHAIPELVLLNLTTGWDGRLFACLSCINKAHRDIVREVCTSPITNQHELHTELVRLGTTSLDIGWSPRFPVPRLQLIHACPSDAMQHSTRRRQARAADVSDLLGSQTLSKFIAGLIEAYIDGLSSQLNRAALVDLLKYEGILKQQKNRNKKIV